MARPPLTHLVVVLSAATRIFGFQGRAWDRDGWVRLEKVTAGRLLMSRCSGFRHWASRAGKGFLMNWGFWREATSLTAHFSGFTNRTAYFSAGTSRVMPILIEICHGRVADDVAGIWSGVSDKRDTPNKNNAIPLASRKRVVHDGPQEGVVMGDELVVEMSLQLD